MAVHRRRRRRTWSRAVVLLSISTALAAGVWWVFFRANAHALSDTTVGVAPLAALTTDRPETEPQAGPPRGVSEKGETPDLSGSGKRAESGATRAASLVAAGREALKRGDLVDARTYLSEAYELGVEEPDLSLVRAELSRIGNETIFSPRIFDHDPLVSRHIIEPGETLGKIAKAHKVSPDLVADINGIEDKNRVRAGRTIKLISGPFHAVIHKRTFSMDVYLGKTLVKHFKVGLGADDSTPSGEWKVGTKLTNPTYYPPRGGAIIAADDPENPLGERWIGLVGAGGDALGQQRYGIHGTIDPDSIGRAVSLGCIRLYNEDVEALYMYLVEKYSTVTVLD